MAAHWCMKNGYAYAAAGNSGKGNRTNRSGEKNIVLGCRISGGRKSTVYVRAEKTYVMVKPDGVQRGLVGKIVSKFEDKGFTLAGLKLYQAPKELAEEHYKDLSSKPFFPDLVEYICSGPVVCMILEGKGVVASARKLIGATNPLESEPGTIRGDFRF